MKRNFLDTRISLSKLLSIPTHLVVLPLSLSFLCADIYRENWALFHPVQHLWHFSPDNLAILFEKYGLKPVWKDLQYLGTPYAQPKADLMKIADKIENPDSQEISPPFFENMMSLVFQKN